MTINLTPRDQEIFNGFKSLISDPETEEQLINELDTIRNLVYVLAKDCQLSCTAHNASLIQGIYLGYTFANYIKKFELNELFEK